MLCNKLLNVEGRGTGLRYTLFLAMYKKRLLKKSVISLSHSLGPCDPDYETHPQEAVMLYCVLLFITVLYIPKKKNKKKHEYMVHG